MTGYAEVTVSFVVPQDDANAFCSLLSIWINRKYILDHLYALPWAYFGIHQEEWELDPPAKGEALQFSPAWKFSREKSSSDVRSTHEAFRDGYVEGFMAGGGDAGKAIDRIAKFSREKSPDERLRKAYNIPSDVVSPGLLLDVGTLIHNMYDRGYAEGFEAGGGCVSEDLSREKSVDDSSEADNSG